jgi:hypothetical protein
MKDAMKIVVATLLLPVALLSACNKAPEATAPPADTAELAAPAPAATPAPTPAPASAAEPAELTEAQKEMAHKQGQLDYATMEDGFITDPLAQWASGGTATTTYASYVAANATGKVDGEYWASNGGDVGFDSIELTFAKPVSATQVRAAFDQGSGIGRVVKVELQDVDGKWNVVWSGISDVERDNRGRRTWFVRTFPATEYKAKGAKFTLMNTSGGSRAELDAAQLVGQ